MSSGEVRRVSRQDIQLVQNLIERCLQLYMNQKEVVATLLHQAKIEPGFTELVWQKLEEENPEFFKAYRLRLMVKQQIIVFNKLLEKQVELMSQICPTGVNAMPISNESDILPMHHQSACYAPENTGPALKPENMHHPINCTIPNTFTNGESSLNTGMHMAVAMSADARRMDAQPDMLPTQSSDMGLVQGINGGTIKSENSYAGASQFMCSADGNVLDTHQTIEDGSLAAFSSMDSHSQPLNDQLLDAGTPSIGFLDRIPRSFSLSDLTYNQSSDILEYSRSIYLEQGDDKKMDSISESLSYEGFGE